MATETTPFMVEDAGDGLYDISYTVSVKKGGLNLEQVSSCIEERTSMIAMLPSEDETKDDS